MMGYDGKNLSVYCHVYSCTLVGECVCGCMRVGESLCLVCVRVRVYVCERSNHMCPCVFISIGHLCACMCVFGCKCMCVQECLVMVGLYVFLCVVPVPDEAHWGETLKGNL